MCGVVVEDRGLRLRINHETLVTDVVEGVGLHAVSMVRKIRGLRGHADAWDLARNAAGFFEALWLAGLGLDTCGAKLFHVSEGEFFKRRKRDAVAIVSVVLDF